MSTRWQHLFYFTIISIEIIYLIPKVTQIYNSCVGYFDVLYVRNISNILVH